MTRTDREFLKALGIKPEEIVPADSVPVQFGNPGVFAYETCPECGRKRHRVIADGKIFCLSCSARKRRDQALKDAQFTALIDLAYQRAIAKHEDPDDKSYYRGFEIRRLEGTGWCFRRPGELWTQAKSRREAQRHIERLVGPLIYEEPYPFVPVNQCRECGEPCGQMKWCGPCGKAKFL